MAKESIKKIVAAELQQFLVENGYELYDVQFVKEAKDWFLRVYIEKAPGQAIEKAMTETEEYISVDDCEKVSRFLSQKLDEKDPVDQNYYLEVSSPGMDRELLKEADYQRFAGRQVEVKLYKAVNGIKKFEGILEGRKENKVTVIEPQGKKWELPIEEIAKINLAVVF